MDSSGTRRVTPVSVLVLQNKYLSKCLFHVTRSKWQNKCVTLIYKSRSSFSACLDGFFGQECNTSCTYPTYGKNCQFICSCRMESCNVAMGCLQGNFSHQFSDGLSRFQFIVSITEENIKILSLTFNLFLPGKLTKTKTNFLRRLTMKHV